MSREGLPARSLFAGAAAAAGLPIYIHAPKAYADLHGVGLGALGAALFGLRLLDFVQDPALGWLAERARARRGASVALAAAPRLSSQAIAFDVVGRNAITHDPRFAAGQYYDAGPPVSGLAIARMLAHITYLSRESMGERFDPVRAAPHSCGGI